MGDARSDERNRGPTSYRRRSVDFSPRSPAKRIAFPRRGHPRQRQLARPSCARRRCASVPKPSPARGRPGRRGSPLTPHVRVAGGRFTAVATDAVVVARAPTARRAAGRGREDQPTSGNGVGQRSARRDQPTHVERCLGLRGGRLAAGRARRVGRVVPPPSNSNSTPADGARSLPRSMMRGRSYVSTARTARGRCRRSAQWRRLEAKSAHGLAAGGGDSGRSDEAATARVLGALRRRRRGALPRATTSSAHSPTPNSKRTTRGRRRPAVVRPRPRRRSRPARRAAAAAPSTRGCWRASTSGLVGCRPASSLWGRSSGRWRRR